MTITPNQILIMMGPAIAATFSLIFLGMRLYARSHAYLGLLSLAYFAFGLGAASQILLLPADPGLNTIVSALLYTLSVLALAQGILQRSGKGFSPAWQFAVALLIVLPTAYFHYSHPSLLVRTYILNFGLGSVLVAAAVKLRALRHAKPIDRLVWWTLLVFGLHFFPRILLTAEMLSTTSLDALGHSLFWLVLHVTLTLSSIVLAAILLIATPVDIIDALKEDRDHDVLSGLLNRRGFERRAKAEMIAFGDTPASLVVCDIDHFKLVNDTYGHPAGDRVLKDFSRLLRQSLRSVDVVARIGGEEFVALLPDCDAHDALFLVERLRLRLTRERYAGIAAHSPVTASFGVSEHAPGESLWDWFARTDIALYAAKTGGRNRIFIHQTDAGVANRTPHDDATEDPPAERRGQSRHTG